MSRGNRYRICGPLFLEYCFVCHRLRADQREAGLRLGLGWFWFFLSWKVFCFDAGSLRGAAGPTNGRLVSVALFTLIVNPQHDRSPLQAHLVCETASPSRLILHEIRLFLASAADSRIDW